MKEITPAADLVLRIMAVSEAWGFEAINKTAIAQAFEILEPLIAAPPKVSNVGADNNKKESDI